MKNKTSLFFIVTGLLCIAAALILFINNIAESRRAQTDSRLIAGELTALLEEQDGSTSQFPTDNPYRAMPVITVEDRGYAGIIAIPELDLELPVAARFDYDALKSTPCLYSGNVYSGNMVIAAHNYDSHFGRISSLMPGSGVFFTDTENHRYAYEVYDIETLNPNQQKALIQDSGEGRELTLFTCNYSGVARIVIRCKSV